jgi:hypothetical protein
MPSTDHEPSRRRPGRPGRSVGRTGASARFPRSPQIPSTGSAPSYGPAAIHEYAADLPRDHPASRVHHSGRVPRRRTRSTSEFAAAQPTSARFELVVSLEGLHNAGFSRTPFCLASQAQAVWQYQPVPSLSGLLPPSPASPGSGCPQLQPACCDSPAVKVSHPHSNPQRLVAHLIHEPPITAGMRGRACRVDELECEPRILHAQFLDATSRRLEAGADVADELVLFERQSSCTESSVTSGVRPRHSSGSARFTSRTDRRCIRGSRARASPRTRDPSRRSAEPVLRPAAPWDCRTSRRPPRQSAQLPGGLDATAQWAGLRTFAPDRLPVVRPDRAEPTFHWYAGLGGFSIMTSPALGQALAGGVLARPAPTARASAPERSPGHRSSRCYTYR